MPHSDDLFTPDFKTEPYWWDQIPRPEPGTPDPPARADVVVIGSGYTGLHAALVTARGGRHTVVLDAEDAGWGCSTRNGGQISTSVKPDLDELARRCGEERAREIHREGHRALAWIGEFVRGEGIECDFRVCGRFHGAHSPAAWKRLVRRVEQPPADVPRDLIPEAEVIPRAEQHRELGTEAYHGGVLYTRFAGLDPGRYHRGLLETVEGAGARVIARCAVTGIERTGTSFRVHSARGVTEARDVVLATNGYTGPLTPWQRRRVIPIGSYVIATEPLAPGLMDRLIPNNRMVGDSRRVVYYYRASPDRTRILFGGRVSFSETDPLVSAPRLHAAMAAIFPELAGVRVSHSWMGFVAYTFDTIAHTGTQDGIHYSMGYCGSGVSMASYLGMRAGQRVLGMKEGHTPFEDVAFPSRPFYTGDPWFLAPSVMYYRWLDRLGV